MLLRDGLLLLHVRELLVTGELGLLELGHLDAVPGLLLLQRRDLGPELGLLALSLLHLRVF